LCLRSVVVAREKVIACAAGLTARLLVHVITVS
jgi:hypothetical protein